MARYDDIETANKLEVARNKMAFSLGILRISAKIAISSEVRQSCQNEIAQTLRRIDKIDATIMKLRGQNLVNIVTQESRK